MGMKRNKKKIMTFGETVLRLSPEHYKRFGQADKFQVFFGGAEANVAVSLSYMGFQTGYVTKLPENEMADAAIRYLDSFQVDTGHILRGGKRMGLFFMEQGVSLRPGKVIYDREHSAIAEAEPEEFDWEKILKDAEWFHVTGISPALSDKMAVNCLEACKTAKKLGIMVSLDVNYRSSLWSTEKAGTYMDKLSHYVDLCFANEEEIEQVYGIPSAVRGKATALGNHEVYGDMANELMRRYPFGQVALTLLDTISADQYRWQAVVYDKEGEHYSRLYEAVRNVDRDGVGDAFSAGLIAGILSRENMKEAVEFGTAAAALKFSVEGDINLVRYEEVEQLAGKGNSIDVKR